MHPGIGHPRREQCPVESSASSYNNLTCESIGTPRPVLFPCLPPCLFALSPQRGVVHTTLSVPFSLRNTSTDLLLFSSTFSIHQCHFVTMLCILLLVSIFSVCLLSYSNSNVLCNPISPASYSVFSAHINNLSMIIYYSYGIRLNSRRHATSRPRVFSVNWTTHILCKSYTSTDVF